MQFDTGTADHHSEYRNRRRAPLISSGEKRQRPLLCPGDNENVPTATTPNRQSLIRQGQRLEYFTIAYNSAEGLVSIVAGLIAGSVSLIAFGLDSLIEVASGGGAAGVARPLDRGDALVGLSRWRRT